MKISFYYPYEIFKLKANRSPDPQYDKAFKRKLFRIIKFLDIHKATAKEYESYFPNKAQQLKDKLGNQIKTQIENIRNTSR